MLPSAPLRALRGVLASPGRGEGFHGIEGYRPGDAAAGREALSAYAHGDRLWAGGRRGTGGIFLPRLQGRGVVFVAVVFVVVVVVVVVVVTVVFFVVAALSLFKSCHRRHNRHRRRSCA